MLIKKCAVLFYFVRIVQATWTLFNLLQYRTLLISYDHKNMRLLCLNNKITEYKLFQFVKILITIINKQIYLESVGKVLHPRIPSQVLANDIEIIYFY